MLFESFWLTRVFISLESNSNYYSRNWQGFLKVNYALFQLFSPKGKVFLRICWIYKSGPEKILDKNDVGEKQKTEEFFWGVGGGCKGEVVLRKWKFQIGKVTL